MAIKLNNADNYEPIEIFLSKEKTPIAYQAKYEELIENGMTQEQAEEFLRMPIECEVYYEKGVGLFLVESEAVESGTIYSPYSGELCEDADV